MKIFKVVFTIAFFSVWILPTTTKASNAPNQFITIVNPVRISSYSEDPAVSLNTEYEEIKKRNLPATWLFTYDALNKSDLVAEIKKMDRSQELGIFMEITPEFAREAQVIYKKTDSWHRANSVFLSGYNQEERKKLIDTIFRKFKEVLGFYPVSVGAWWNDSFSLQYMKDKYQITANLTCADQFQTDGYHLWGQYWGAPFYPSKNHAGIPAQNSDSSLDIVNIQWAPRDPLNGYWSSLYSTQDYFTRGLDINYFEKLIKLYGESHKNIFGQITLGLEGDFTPETYQGNYSKQIQLIASLRDSGDYKIMTMQQFSDWYRSFFKGVTPDYFIESGDLLNKDQKAFWYQSPRYRIGLIYDDKESKLTVLDFRIYFNNFQEPYYLSPNFGIDLYINNPSIIDIISNPQSKWEINNVKLKSFDKKDNDIYFYFENGKTIKLTSQYIIFDKLTKSFNTPSIIKNSPKINLQENENSVIFYPKLSFNYNQEGLIFPDLSIQATYFLWRPKIYLVSIGVVGFLIMVPILVFFKRRSAFKLKMLVAFYAPFIVVGIFLLLTNLQFYQVNQSEVDALEHLAALPYGKVVVVQGGCLICKWQTKYAPAAFAGKKDYVGWLAHKPIVYNKTLFPAKSREEGRKQLNRLGVKYIYLVKYEGYVEEMPFSPGDLNVEKIYENANTQIWQIKTS